MSAFETNKEINQSFLIKLAVIFLHLQNTIISLSFQIIGLTKSHATDISNSYIFVISFSSSNVKITASLDEAIIFCFFCCHVVTSSSTDSLSLLFLLWPDDLEDVHCFMNLDVKLELSAVLGFNEIFHFKTPTSIAATRFNHL